MNYEKKYKEALERARQIKNGEDGWGYSDLVEITPALEEVFPELAESEDERIKLELLKDIPNVFPYEKAFRYIHWLEKQKDASKAIEAVDRIDKYIDEHLANAHDMKDSNPDKKYYRGWDDALGKMAGILQDVYSGKKQKDKMTAKEGMITVSKEAWDENAKDSFERGIKVGMIRRQKEQKPAEIDEEINRWMGCEAFPEGINITPLPQAMEIVERTAKHFFELGEKTVPSPGGYWEGFKDGVRECQSKLQDVKGAMKEHKPRLIGEDSVEKKARQMYETGQTIEEQKPAEWSEYDKQWLSEVYFAIDHSMYSDDERRAMKKYIDSLRLQPKQEWSEEDKKMLKDCCAAVTSSDYYFSYEERCAMEDWLKSLHTKVSANSEKVNVNWSEDDEEKLKAICAYLQDYSRLAKLGDKLRFNEYCDFLKSLRPSWKPSEEQMEALKNVAFGAYQNGDGPALRGLYEQLKKLM